MIFNSFQFIWLFPLFFIAYYSLSYIRNQRLQHSIKNWILIVISYSLYAQWDIAYTSFLFGVTFVTYFGAKILVLNNALGQKKYLITIFVILTFLPLLIFKYYDFIHYQVGNILSQFNIGIVKLKGLNWAIPIGISFYTFQAVGYLWDVYYKKIEVENKFSNYVLFVCFFPQILSGPISKAKDLLPQIKQYRPFNYYQAVEGCKALLWGMFLKVVFADRIGIIVDTILPNYNYLDGLTCLFGAILYSLQIYGDFAGYSLMALGVGKIMGFNLINNFKRPYFAPTITDFWKRWHISLTQWLTAYIYIPLGGSRCNKIKTYRNIMITFLVSGIWHGANWTFILWGALHGFLQIIEKFFGIQKCKNGLLKPIRILSTFLIVTLAWIFFRVPTIIDGCLIIEKIFTDLGSFGLSIDRPVLILAMFSTFVVFIKEWFNEYKPSFSILNSNYTIVRWGAYISLFFLIILCGVLDAGSFIYVSF